MGIKHILVVDDSEIICDMLKPMILENGFSVDTANNCEEAYRKIRQRKPDLIVLDLVLPDASGMDFCGHLKQEPDTKLIPIIMCTASAISPKDKAKGFDLGADDYLTKPFEMKELMSRIRALLRRTELFEREIVHRTQNPAAVNSEAPAAQEPKSPDAGFLQVLGWAFVSPLTAFRQVGRFPSGWSVPWILGIVSMIALARSFPVLFNGSFWEFLKALGSVSASLAGALLGAAVLAYALILVFFRRRFPFRQLFMSLTLAAVPWALAGLLAGIYVLWAGRGASVQQFSAGIGLLLPAVRTPTQEAWARVLDLFTIWPVFTAAAGLSEISRLPIVRLFLALAVSWMVPIALMAVF